MNIEYIGERLLPNNLGYALIIISMMAALFSALSFYFSEQSKDETAKLSWKRFGRGSFALHGISVISIVLLLFYIISNHYWEYQYVWQHSSEDLPWYYRFSCFWEGQEGSTLLWMFWHVVLGGVLMRTAGKWEGPTLSILALIQFFLTTMILGIFILGYKWGSNPFILMRDFSPENPIFLRANYVSLIKDGSGLNPLLQNYWMVIHPPILFLGFASVSMPFVYAIAALWKRDYSDWVKPTIAWTLFSGALLGTGIMMGSAWAYESLSFGGFWAWDPVENASLVPLLVMIAGLHTLLAYKHTGHALKATLLLLIMSFWFIVYSTFLTKSGVLGDTSVHSFTDMGMSGQLLIFLIFFVLFSIIVMAVNWKYVPTKKEEESAYSKEFWLFVGSLFLVIFGIWISIDTSLPAFNKLFGTDWVIVDAVSHYNRYALWFGVLTAFLSATIQYFKYKKTTLKYLGLKIWPSVGVALIATIWMAYFLDIWTVPYTLLMFAGLFTITANIGYVLNVLSGKIKVAGASVAHIGFGMMLLGMLIPNVNKEVISINRTGIMFDQNIKPEENVENILLNKDMPIKMGDYWVTYLGDSVVPPNTVYKVKYERKEKINDPAKETFILEPNAQVNPTMGLVSNPSTHHYWSKDIFTHVSMVFEEDDSNESEKLSDFEMAIGDTMFTSNVAVILKGITPNPSNMRYVAAEGDIAAGAQIVVNDTQKNYEVEPIYFIRDNVENGIDALIEDLGMRLRFEKIMPTEGKIKLSVIETQKPLKSIIMKAIIFPGINLLWIGTIMCVMGFLMSLVRRLGERSA